MLIVALLTLIAVAIGAVAICRSGHRQDEARFRAYERYLIEKHLDDKREVA